MVCCHDARLTVRCRFRVGGVVTAFVWEIAKVRLHQFKTRVFTLEALRGEGGGEMPRR